MEGKGKNEENKRIVAEIGNVESIESISVQ